MPKRKPFLRLFTERGPLIVLAVAASMMFGIVAPASAQFFDFGFGGFGRRPAPQHPQQQRGFFAPFGDVFGPRSSEPQQAPRPQDFSRAPPPAKREAPAERNVLVLGDAMADWLAYGLEDALSETPELGVIRKHKTVSGLIKYQPKGEPSDWAAAAKSILATEKPDAIVVMLGLHDRIPIREPEKKADAKSTDKSNDKADKKGAKKPDDKAADGKPADNKTADSKPAEAKPGDTKPADSEVAPDDDEQPSIVAPEKAARSGGGSYEFRDDRWVELYTKKIEEMIAVLKTKGVPVLWVGLPAVRGPKATSDMLFLDALYRDAAGKAGITYVDVWDGFVDDSGRFAQQGPDFEGQIRRLRSSDGVFFTKAGARKLAHYTEREIRRVLGSRTAPVELPTEPEASVGPSVTPDAAGRPRPLVGPIMPLVASSVGGDELLGGTGARPTSVDALTSRTLVKGDPLSPPAGRADDFSWPRREVGSLTAPAGDPAVVAAPSDGSAAAASAAKPKPKRPPQSVAQGSVDGQAQGGSSRQRAPREAPHPAPSGFSSFFPWFSR
ncbi:DUF459 domain-containing protein [Bradyrhizobium sp. SYSU BS000235]|uniref:SGNH/GDSL hydrolase family protein n=1 Tax=Bradyrhizobium sp. SYSU BS000235 TaxID=3411332 RepID=UPI003C72A89F